MADATSIDHRELARRSQDRLRVLNPTEQDYAVQWDGYLHNVPAGGEAVFPRYIAEKYMKEMTDKILTERQDKAVAEENKRRNQRGEKEMEKWGGEAQDVLENKYALMQGVRNPEARREIMKSLHGGLVEEYGLDLPTRQEATKNLKNMDDAILAELEKSPLESITQSEKAPIEELEDKGIFELHKIARDKGVDFEKTDKKDELIAKIAQ